MERVFAERADFRRKVLFAVWGIARSALDKGWMMRLAQPVFGLFHPFHPEFRRDPYPFYRRLREEAPVYFSPVFRGWILSRHADVERVLRDPRFSVERERADFFRKLDLLGGVRPEFAEALRRNLLMLDPPAHTRLRRLVSQAFTPRRVEELRPKVEALVEELLDRMARHDEVEFIESFAYPLPVAVIAELLGVPTEDRDRFKTWSDALTAVLDPLQAPDGLGPAERAFAELSEYFRHALETRRREPRDDLLGVLARADESGDRLSEVEILSLCMLLLAAGHETTTNLLANALLAFARFPGEARRLRKDPSLAPLAVEECLRYTSPIQLTDRVALEDLEIGGHRIRKHQLVGLLLAAANRDPEIFPDPDRLDVTRDPNPHLAFGQGTHFCLGAHLARLEAQIALPALFRRFPDLHVDPRVEYRRSMVLRAPASLRVRLS
ncbi:MAG: cytochrome P450 [Candidatus Binatia bacterium]|nr:MAG: cytochrome P450 [Candidatus Binatia bacterium]